MIITIENRKNLPSATKKLLEAAGNCKIFAFYGAMGSGKTTIIKHLCKTLGAVDVATSPTFTLVNEYKTKTGKSIYHFDFYRIKKIEEVFDFGIEEYFASGSYCFLEWPKLAEDALPTGDIVKIQISVEQNNQRILNISMP
jgi:tRNA threonylcarbamoyladenosine biosynthesis protein TsaE